VAVHSYHDGAAPFFPAPRQGRFCHLSYSIVNIKDIGIVLRPRIKGRLTASNVTKLPVDEIGNKEHAITQVVSRIPSRTGEYRQQLTVAGSWQRWGGSR